jgi:hypothetical protein
MRDVLDNTMLGKDMKTTRLEQYKSLFPCFNGEVSRFWSRFNILMGIQMGAFIGILASLKMLVANPSLFRLSLLLMTLYSFATAVIAIRGHLMHEAVLRTLSIMESNSDGELKLLALGRKSSGVPVGLNQNVGACIACIFIIVWLSLFIMAKIHKYQLMVAK